MKKLEFKHLYFCCLFFHLDFLSRERKSKCCNFHPLGEPDKTRGRGSIPILSTLKIKTLQRRKVLIYFWNAHLECPLSAHFDYLSGFPVDFSYC